MSSPKAFHVSIVEAIDRARDAHELSILASLINQTTVPRNHDAIVAAWNAKLAELGHEVMFSIVESVMAQKPDYSRMSPEERFLAEAEDVAREHSEMSDEEVMAYLKENHLEDLVSEDRVDEVLRQATEEVRNRRRSPPQLTVIPKPDTDQPKSED